MAKVVKTAKALALGFLLLALFCALSGKAYTAFLKSVYPLKFEEYVASQAQNYGVEEALIYAVIKAESGFDVNAKSRAGAQGLMQITPDTFSWLQTHAGTHPMNQDYLKNPGVNIKYGTYFISILLEKYGSEEVALCAYNAGMGSVDRWLKDKNLSRDQRTLTNIPYPETKKYVARVLRHKARYKNLYKDKTKEGLRK